MEAKLTDENGISVLHLSDVDTGGQITDGHIDFYCNSPRLLARAYFPPPLLKTFHTLVQMMQKSCD